jgi:hypothetical protein
VIIENLETLAGVLEGMDVGQRLDAPRIGFRSLWPRPEMPLKDDYLSDAERAQRWCEHFGCEVRALLDQPGLRFEKVRVQAPEFRGFRPGPPPVDEVSRESMMEFFRR